MEKNERGFKGFFNGGMRMNHKVDLKKDGFFEWGIDGGVRYDKRYECRGPKCKSIVNPSSMATKKERERARIQKWKQKT